MANVNNYQVHPYTKKTVQYDVTQLAERIKELGQLSPAILWKNKRGRWVIVDGVHRQRACNLLGIKLKVIKLPETITEENIPAIVLDLQLSNKSAGRVEIACEAVVYLANTKDTAKRLVSIYPKLSPDYIKRLKTILRIRPQWFKTLQLGDKVEYGDGGKMSNSPRFLASICAEEEKRVSEEYEDAEEDGDKTLAEIFSLMHITDRHMRKIAKSDQIMYVYEQMIAEYRERQTN
jgi:hypothetical protein